MKIGVMLESFRCDFKTGVEKAAALGLDGIQKYACSGELDWTEAQIKEALDIVRSHGMVFSALCGDFGYGFDDPARNPEMIEKSKRVIDLAKKLDCSIVTTHVHQVPKDECASKEVMRAACRELGQYAESMDATFALETGPEFGEILAGFLDSVDTKGVRINFDPANLVMVAGDTPVNALKYLGKYIVHTHAKDGRKLERGFVELPLGTGDVDFDTYLPALKASGFDGFLTIEREVGEDPEADIKLAADFLREKIKAHNL